MFVRRLFDFLRDKGFTGARHSDLVVAINFRLTALARLSPNYAGKSWTLPGRNGAIPLPADVLVEAAAEEPLVEDVDGMAFDADSFARRVLQLAEVRKREDARPASSNIVRTPPSARRSLNCGCFN